MTMPNVNGLFRFELIGQLHLGEAGSFKVGVIYHQRIMGDEIIRMGIIAHRRDEERPNGQVAQSVGYIAAHSAERLPDGTAMRTRIHLQQMNKQTNKK